MPAKVEVYTTQTCPYCIQAKRLLRERNIAFSETDVSEAPDTRQWLRRATGRHTVPQIFINDRAIGGFDDLSELDRSGELERLLNERPGELRSG